MEFHTSLIMELVTGLGGNIVPKPVNLTSYAYPATFEFGMTQSITLLNCPGAISAE